MRILAIDPGYDRMGIAVIDKEKNSKEKLVFSGCITTSKKLPFPERLRIISEELEKAVNEYKPDIFASEKIFFSKNRKTAMLVAEARGAIVATASRLGLPIKELSPAEIKMATTGSGGSDKTQVRDMLKYLIKIDTKVKYDDEYDAIATGVAFFAFQKMFDIEKR